VLQPYFPVAWSNDLNQCPAYTGLLPADWPVRDPGGGMVSSYGYNTWGVTWEPVNIPAVNDCLGIGVDAIRVLQEQRLWDSATVTPPLHHRESETVAPSELYAFMDSRGSPMVVPSGNSTTQVWAGWDSTDGTPVSTGDYPFLQGAPQHGAYFNVLSCDGHVSAARLSDLFQQVPPGSGHAPGWKSAHNWNVDNQPHAENWMFE
jgi:hypothetical protein